MRDLLILGIGVHAREMVEIVERVNAVQPTWNLLGFLSPDGKYTGKMFDDLSVLGGWETLKAYPEALLVPDNEWPRTINVPLERLTSLVDPSAFVSRTAQIGRGCVVYPHCFIGLNAWLGDYVFCMSGCVINHDDAIGDRTMLSSGVILAGSVHIEEDCYLGLNCTVSKSLRIGHDSSIGMGAVVVKDLPPKSVMAGHPAHSMAAR
ncbi:MAG: DapH/DapD/GlmU-related protein [Armatimonadota bacterium]